MIENIYIFVVLSEKKKHQKRKFSVSIVEDGEKNLHIVLYAGVYVEALDLFAFKWPPSSLLSFKFEVPYHPTISKINITSTKPKYATLVLYGPNYNHL